MQPQILKHFTSNFSNEPIETQDQILEKLFLTIRTTSIQQKILEFIDIHYDIFTLEQKKKFYEMYFEMLPECDALASSLTKMVNKHSIKEDEDLIDYIKSNLEKKLEADYRKKESNMLPILMYENEDQTCTEFFIISSGILYSYKICVGSNRFGGRYSAKQTTEV